MLATAATGLVSAVTALDKSAEQTIAPLFVEPGEEVYAGQVVSATVYTLPEL